MTAPTHHVTAALNLPTHVPDVIARGRHIITAMTNNAHFTNATQQLAAASAALDALEIAETNAATNAKGTAAVRDAALVKAKTQLRQLGAYVQLTADNGGDQAEAIIVSAGLDVRKVTPRQKQVFEAEQGVSGTVVLFGVVVAKASAYNWQMSTDGKNWTPLPTTTRAKTTVTGLTPGMTYYFRHEPVLRKAGVPEWSQVISILVK